MGSISDYMQKDHAEIDAIAGRAAGAAASGDLPGMAREGAQFLDRLERHIEVEEELLFPAFEERTGMTEAGPSLQMREEHVPMQEHLRAMREAIQAGDAAAWQRASEPLLELLVPHNQKEEQMMYPMLDDALGPDASTLLDEVRAIAV